MAKDVHELPLDETAVSGGLKPYQPKNGLFVLAYVTARNVGNQPATMSVTDAMLTDSNGKSFRCTGPYLGGVVGQELGEEQQPDTARSGFIVFDVPPSIGEPTTLTVQSDAYMDTTNPVTVVDVSAS
ncbi:DUF4352 domain-containing protein [Dactylosporangium sp. CS-033363]|uniref:DUF4352 domain-containing protein n=1 Tax=Dactylosporangium sp. CS-033363 TaxID=3239935 RepID=UPI003D8D2001